MESLMKIYERSFRNNFSLPALTEYGSTKTMTYGDLAKKIAGYHEVFRTMGIKRGDKIALMGKNTPTWVTVFLATITYGAIIVPILQDFNPKDAQHIINHSDATVLFVSNSIWDHIDPAELKNIRAVISLDNETVLHEIAAPGAKKTYASTLRGLSRRMRKMYPDGFTPLDICYQSGDGEDIAVINYTSGTTGFSKGVMLTQNNLLGNTLFGIDSKLHYPGSRALSFLPLAHAYGCAFDMLVPLTVGAHITILGKAPTPMIIVKAMAEVKPNLIICVPLVLEKIYRKVIVPMITKGPIRWVLAIPGLDMAVYSRIRAKLVESFGGCFEEVIVGGAPLNPEVEQFLHKIKFPFTVGYGMTECAPLISYTPWREFKTGSSGHTLRGYMTAKIVKHGDEPTYDAEGHEIGEIAVKGMNVMKGYYKNEKATEDVLDADGWLHTGDMGYLGGEDGQTIFIRGRYKTMILSANGQNIYPEEIEAKLNNMPYVSESLIVNRNGHLTALVYPDTEAVDRFGISMDDLGKIMEETRVELNKLLAPYEQVHSIQLVPQEFEKTPKRSIKRFLYN